MKKYSTFCFLLTGVFYIIQVSVLGFTVYYLSENGYTPFEVGALLTTFGIIAMIAQRLLGNFADENPKIDFKSILTLTGLICIVLFICMYFLNKNKLAVGLLFGTAFTLTNCMSPFVNESCFYYTNKGINVDYGKARGIGSLSFAIASLILGTFTDKFGARSISFNGIIFASIFLLIIMFMPRIGSDNETNVNESVVKNKVDGKDNANIINLIKKYPSFFLIVAATVFAMCFQNADCGYLINIIEDIGGDASNLGLANAIAAMVEIPIMFMITKIMKKIKVKKLIVVACAFYIIRGLVFCIPSMTAIYAAQVLQMFSYAILTPAIVYLADEMMYDEDKNKGQTFIGMAVTSGLILGSYVGGQLITSGGIRLLENGCVVIAVISFIFAVLGNIVK